MEDDKQVKRPALCNIEIMFPVETDADALKIKALISDALKDVPQKRIRFSITEG